MKIYSPSDVCLRGLSEIEPNGWYGKGCFSTLIFHRGRNMQEALNHDPAAPVGQAHPIFKTRTVYLGQDILDYMASYSDDALPVAGEIERQRKEDRIEINREMETLKRQQRLEHEAALKKIGDTREAVLKLVWDHMRDAMIDITRETNLSCGVYFLRDQGEIVYVGQSVSVYNRVSQHRQQKKFDSVSFLPCRRDQLNNLEGFFIRLLKPKLNGHSRDGVHGAPSSWLWGDVVELDATLVDE